MDLNNPDCIFIINIVSKLVSYFDNLTNLYIINNYTNLFKIKADPIKLLFFYAIFQLDTKTLALSFLTYIFNCILKVKNTESTNKTVLFKLISRINFIHGIYSHIKGLLLINVKENLFYIPFNIYDLMLKFL